MFKKILPYLLLLIISIWSVWPAVRSPLDTLTQGNEDILAVWILNQTIQKIPDNLGNIFQGNIFFPFQNTMAYSELFIPSALLSSIPVKLTGSPFLAYNFTLFIGQFLTMLVIYLWFKELTGKNWPAALGAIALGLSQIRIHYFAHLQMWSLQWFLASVFLIWKYRKTEQIKYLFFAGLFFVIQIWESLLPAMLTAFAGVILLFPKRLNIRLRFKKILVVAGMVGALVFPVARVYWQVSSEQGLKRTIRDAAHFSLSVEEIGGKFLSPGMFILTGLAFYSIGRKNFSKEKEFAWLIPLLFLGLIMAMGPVLKINQATFKIFNIPIPLPYAIAHYLVPGFGAFRTPSRWIWLFAFASSGIITLGFSKLRGKAYKIILPLAIILAIVGGSKVTTSVSMPTASEYPEVYRWLKNQEGDAILELPVMAKEFYRMLYSLEHRKYLVNGSSGFSPPEWQMLVTDITNNFPSKELENRLSAIGVDFIIVHKDQIDDEKLKIIISWGKNKLIREYANTLVYKL